MLIDADGNGKPQTIPNDKGWGSLTFARCTADESAVLYVAEYEGANNVYKIDLAGGQPERLTDFVDATAIQCAELSPDGQILAFTAPSTVDPRWKQSVIYTKSLTTGELEVAISNLFNPSKGEFHKWSHFAWSPDGTKIVAQSEDNVFHSNLDTFLYYQYLYTILVK